MKLTALFTSLRTLSLVLLMMFGAVLADEPVATNKTVWADLHASSATVSGLNLSVRNGVVTLSGDVPGSLDRSRIEKVVRESAGVRKVINLITAM